MGEELSGTPRTHFFSLGPLVSSQTLSISEGNKGMEER